MRRVVYREERYVIQSISFHFRTKFQFLFNQLNQRRSLREFRTECMKAQCVSLSNQLYCIALEERSYCRRGGGGRGVGQWKAGGRVV